MHSMSMLGFVKLESWKMPSLLQSLSVLQPPLSQPIYSTSRQMEVLAFMSNQVKHFKHVANTKLRGLGFPNWIIDNSDSKPSELGQQLGYKSYSNDEFESTITISIYFWLMLIIFYLFLIERSLKVNWMIERVN